MISRLLTLCTAASVIAVPSSSRAQEHAADEVTTIMSVAAVRARSGYPAGPTRIDVAGNSLLEATHVAAIARALNAEVATVQATHVCSGATPDTCGLVGASVFLQIATPDITNETAQVRIRVLQQTDSRRQPVHAVGLLVSLARRWNTWVVIDSRVTWET